MVQLGAQKQFTTVRKSCERADWICSRTVYKIGSVLETQICLGDGRSRKG